MAAHGFLEPPHRVGGAHHDIKSLLQRLDHQISLDFATPHFSTSHSLSTACRRLQPPTHHHIQQDRCTTSAMPLPRRLSPLPSTVAA